MYRLLTKRQQWPVLLRGLVVLVLALSLLVPKLSLSASLLFGEGYRSVVICSGTQLVQMTLTPDGELIEDPTQAWVTPHCLLTVHDVVSCVRAWQLASYPSFRAISLVFEERAVFSPHWLGLTISNRGPPLTA